jgi:hypothetical protein
VVRPKVIGIGREQPYLPESNLDEIHHLEIRMTTIIQTVKR